MSEEDNEQEPIDVLENELYAVGVLEAYFIKDNGDEFLTQVAQFVPLMYINYGLTSVSVVLLKFISAQAQMPSQVIMEELRKILLDMREEQNLFENALYAMLMIDETINNKDSPIEQKDWSYLINTVEQGEILSGFLVINSILLRMTLSRWNNPIELQGLLNLIRQSLIEAK